MSELGTKLRSRRGTVATSQEGSSSTGVRLSSQQQLLLGKGVAVILRDIVVGGKAE